jgi:hypothetical protein
MYFSHVQLFFTRILGAYDSLSEIYNSRYTRGKTRLIESNAKMSSPKKGDLDRDCAACVNLSEALFLPRFLSWGGRAKLLQNMVLSFYAYTESSQNIKRADLKCDNLDGSLQTFRKD